MTTTLSAAVTLSSFVLVMSASTATGQGGAHPEIVVNYGVTSAEGITNSDMNLALLRRIEARSLVEMKEKVGAQARAAGVLPTEVPALKSDASLMNYHKTTLAIIRIRSAATLNTVLVLGVVGDELRRVACSRTAHFDANIELFSGPCGDAVRLMFGVKR